MEILFFVALFAFIFTVNIRKSRQVNDSEERKVSRAKKLDNFYEFESTTNSASGRILGGDEIKDFHPD